MKRDKSNPPQRNLSDTLRTPLWRLSQRPFITTSISATTPTDTYSFPTEHRRLPHLSLDRLSLDLSRRSIPSPFPTSDIQHNSAPHLSLHPTRIPAPLAALSTPPPQPTSISSSTTPWDDDNTPPQTPVQTTPSPYHNFPSPFHFSSLSTDTPLSPHRSSQFHVRRINTHSPQRLSAAHLARTASLSTTQPSVRTHRRATALWREWKDRLRKAGRDKWATFCINATSRLHAPPHEPYVRLLLDGLAGGGNPTERHTAVGAVLYHLRERLRCPDWVVLMKTLSVFHTIFRNGNPYFADYLACNNTDIFDKPAFDDVSLDAWLFLPFLTAYSHYLHSWLVLRARQCRVAPFIHHPDLEMHHIYEHSDIDTVLTIGPYLLSTIDALRALPLAQAVLHSPVAKPALLLLLSDLKSLYLTLSTLTTRITTLFPTLPSKTATRALALYTRSRSLIHRLQPASDALLHLFPSFDLPIPTFPAPVLDTLQAIVDRHSRHVCHNLDLLADKVRDISLASLGFSVEQVSTISTLPTPGLTLDLPAQAPPHSNTPFPLATRRELDDNSHMLYGGPDTPREPSPISFPDRPRRRHVDDNDFPPYVYA